ncbi:hypothetical protein IF690_15690 [Pseudomonas sp. SK3(2021)]|uniref:hypothetical protein n=1 Tax=Pseudomonas sp. SK3(2021) TaxID=2841064 RepID=UPI00192B54C0|nr:hypothetical protein [Pseudomonas sp. SK3(2021)]QQZ39505.1 hypothetical protein IF690_15690 [Pseudomonas sp. SK3(2021)]
MSTLLLIDLDGTLIDTPHFEAWRNAAYQLGGKELTQEEYIDHIAGRPRMEGASRLLVLKRDSIATDSANAWSAGDLAQYKQSEFQRLSAGTELFDDALRLLARIGAADQAVTFYTASLNAPRLFDRALRQSNLGLKRQKPVAQQQAGQTRGELFQQLIGNYAPEHVHLIDDSPYATDLACGIGIHAWQIRRNRYEPKANDPRASILSSLDEFALPNKITGKE